MRIPFVNSTKFVVWHSKKMKRNRVIKDMTALDYLY